MKRELCRDFVSVIMGVRPAFMLDYAPLLCKEDVELMCKELNEELFLVRSSRSNGGEGVHLKVCTVLDTVVLVTQEEGTNRSVRRHTISRNANIGEFRRRTSGVATIGTFGARSDNCMSCKSSLELAC